MAEVTEFRAVAVITPEVQEQVVDAGSQLAIVREFVVDSAETAAFVKAEGDRRKKAATQLDEIRKSITAPLRLAETNANNFFQPAIKNLTDAYDHCKGLILGWQQEEEAKHRAAQRAAEEAARKARAEAEAKAAAERAKAEEQAREARKRAEAAEAIRLRALADGNAKAAAKAAADAARAEEQAKATVAEAEAKIAAREVVVVAPPIPVAAPAEIEGFSTRTVWKGRLRGLSDAERAQSKIDLIRAAATDSNAAALLVLDQKALDRLAGALKGSLNIAGIESFSEKVAASRAR